MNKDYHNKFAPDIWLFSRRYHSLYFDIFILIKRWILQKIVNFNFAIFESQVTEILKLELCIHLTFVHRILTILFFGTQKKGSQIL